MPRKTQATGDIFRRPVHGVSTERRGGRPRLRPTASMLVTRVRPTVATPRIACVTVRCLRDLRGYTGMAERLPASRVLPLLDEFLRTSRNLPRRASAGPFFIWQAME